MSLFTITSTLREVGSEAPFAILLADKTIAMRGWCVVFEAWSTSKNPYGRPGMRLGLHRLTKSSREVFERMNALKNEQRASGRPIRLGTQPIILETLTPTSIGMPPIARSPQPSVDEKPARTSMGMPPLARPPQPRMRPASIRIPPRGELTAADIGDAVIVNEPVEHAPTERMVAPPLAAFALGTMTLEPVKPLAPPPVVAIPPVAAVPVPTRFPRGSDRIEMRTPGSELILPANPLMALSDTSLDGFIDCHLYEELHSQGESAEPFAPLEAEAPAVLPAAAEVVALPAPEPAALAVGPALPDVATPIALSLPTPRTDWRRVAIIAALALLAAFGASFAAARWSQPAPVATTTR